MNHLPHLIIAASLLLGAATLSACGEDPGDPTDTGDPHQSAYQVWALDQGTHRGYIYDDRRELIDIIDFNDHDVEVPHMIAFSSDHNYAVVAGMSSGDVTIIRTDDREVLAVIDTGHHTHMASFTPDDRRIIVDVMGHDYRDGTVVEIEADLDTETFTLGRRLVLADDPLIADHRDDFADTSPVCHEYGPDGAQAFITLGPALDNGGLVVLNIETFELEAAFGPQELPVNCGTMPTADRRHMILNGGSSDAGHWYVIDTATFEVVGDQRDSGGLDAHGVWLTPDGSEFWMVNRVTNDGIVIDAETFEVIDRFDELGGTPDILSMSPDGASVYVSLRGPNPVSAPHVAVGDTPGFGILDAQTRQLVQVIQPDEGNHDSDFHGIGVRHLH